MVLCKARRLRDVRLLAPLGFLCIADALFSGSILMIKGLLLVICADGEDYGSILAVGWRSVFFALLLGVVFAAVGLGSSESFRRGGYALGFSHPNQAALYATIVILMCYAEWRLFGKGMAAKLIVCSFCFVCVLLTGSKTALGVIALVFFLSYILGRGGRRGRLFLRILSATPLIVLAFTLITAYGLYEVGLFQGLDEFFTNRIWLNRVALDSFPVLLFGQEGSFNLAGVYNPLRDAWNVTTTIDCTYISCLLSYGVVGMVVWIAGYYVAFRKAWESGSAVIVATLVALALYAFTESQFTNVLLNFGFLCICARLTGQNARCGIQEAR